MNGADIMLRSVLSAGVRPDLREHFAGSSNRPGAIERIVRPTAMSRLIARSLDDHSSKRFQDLLPVAANGRPAARKVASERPEHRRGCLPRALGGVRGQDPLWS
jgi:hypothetical protein